MRNDKIYLLIFTTMLFKVLAFLLFLVNNFNIFNSAKSYKNYSVYDITPTTVHQVKFLNNLLQKKYVEVQFWHRSLKSYDTVQLMVNNADIEVFTERLKHYSLKSKILIPNVEEALRKQTLNNYTRMRLDTYTWDAYYSPEDLNQWLHDVAVTYEKEGISINSIGKSSEGRDIKVIEINKKASPTVIVESGVHGNEWIAIAFVTYLIKHLAASEKAEPAVRAIAKKYHWIIIPVVNPDGFAYTHSEDRLWRKNRRLTYPNTFGVDLNRNFNYSFGKFGTSYDPKDDNYCGTTPFSEPESKVLANFIKSHEKDLKYFFSFHSYGQKIVIPFSDTVKHLLNYGSMANYGKQAAAKIYSMYNTLYDVGTYYDVYGGKQSGNVASWVKKDFDVEYVLTFYLRDNGTYGYALPNDQILPTCEETLQGLLQIMRARIRRVLKMQSGLYTVYSDRAGRFYVNQMVLLICLLSFIIF